MAITTGSRIGPYEVTSPLGEGGMGVVFRALDTKLQRAVALKLLPDHFADDPDRLLRFQREAQLLASLNHPNIAQIYGLEEFNDSRCIVMELVEGDTLQERLRREPIPIDEALPIAKQICEALEAAHEKGIIHRDLKPANIKLTKDGAVKVLDFGLARMREADGAATNISNSPTLMSAASTPGMIMGTAAYMSPEQAKGRPVDGRTDIFAFGSVLYEMLTGRPAFDGEDVPDILSRVLQREPDWSRLSAATPPSISRLLRLCLRKDVKKRRQTATDVRIDIEEALAEPEPAAPVTTPAREPRLFWGVVTVATLALAAFVVLATVHFREKGAPELRVDINTPSTPAPLDFALSPDGRSLVFVASGGGPPRLWVRALDQTEAQPLPGTEGANLPFWSADSRAIGYFASGNLYRVEISGGPPQALANVTESRGGTWSADGTILFAATPGGPLSRILWSGGGEPVAVTRLGAPRQASHRYPQFLPDGRRFLYWVQGTPEGSGIYVGSLEGGEPTRLAAADSSGAFLPPDRIVFQRQTALMVQQVDLTRDVVIGNPVRLADPVGFCVARQGRFYVSAPGHMAYRALAETLSHLTWYDRSGKTVGAAREPDANNLSIPELSPDGQRVAVARVVQGNQDIWIHDLTRGGLTRFTFDPAIESTPVWSPDGARVAFNSRRKGPLDLYVGPSGRTGAEEVLLETPSDKYVQDWSRDGRFLLYSETDPKSGRDLWALPMTGNAQKPFVVVNTRFNEQNGQFAPDGRSVAYETNESGRFEIVVQPFPDARGKWPVSTGGGVQPRWRADGKELYFIAPDGKLMAASITTAAATFAVGTPAALFPARFPLSLGGNKQQYAVSRDGRFLINELRGESSTPITLILNWKPAAK